MSEKMNLEKRIGMLRAIQSFLESSLDESDYDYLCNFLPEAASDDELEYVATSEDIYNTICDIFEEHIQRGGWKPCDILYCFIHYTFHFTAILS